VSLYILLAWKSVKAAHKMLVKLTTVSTHSDVDAENRPLPTSGIRSGVAKEQLAGSKDGCHSLPKLLPGLNFTNILRLDQKS
jgi:hypothetical protein